MARAPRQTLFATVLALTTVLCTHRAMACETEIDPPNLADECYSRSNNALPFWGTVSLPQAGTGLASSGSLTVGMSITRLSGPLDTMIAQMQATIPNLGTIANSVHANEDRSTWMELMLRSDAGTGARGAHLEWVHYGYQNSRIVVLASAVSNAFTLQSTHDLEISFSFNNGAVTAKAQNAGAASHAPPLVELSATGFGTTPPWLKVRWGAQNAASGLASVVVNPDL